MSPNLRSSTSRTPRRVERRRRALARRLAATRRSGLRPSSEVKLAAARQHLPTGTHPGPSGPVDPLGPR